MFVYHRPEHTAAALAALASCPEAKDSDVVVFSDGARDAPDESRVMDVRRIVRSAKGFGSLRLVERNDNWGLARNITEGITRIIGQYGKVIVLEDDLEVSPAFLGYMNSGLQIYSNDERIASVHGYVYPTGCSLPITFFLRGADCWGWATWARAWDKYQSNARTLEKRLRWCPWRNEFDFDGAYPYARMLHEAAVDKIDSWAIRWYTSAFVEGMYTLYPCVSLVRNSGYDGSGTHGGSTKAYFIDLAQRAPTIVVQEPATNKIAYAAFRSYFLSLRPSLCTRVSRRIVGLFAGCKKKS